MNVSSFLRSIVQELINKYFEYQETKVLVKLIAQCVGKSQENLNNIFHI